MDSKAPRLNGIDQMPNMFTTKKVALNTLRLESFGKREAAHDVTSANLD